MYTVAEHVGEYVRLDWDAVDEASIPTRMAFPRDEIHEFIDSVKWTLSRQFRFKKRAHVNLQETRSAKAELKYIAQEFNEPGRHINFVDSRVCLGAWGHGR